MAKVSYLVLDYNRPIESRLCLTSLRENTRFECPIIYFSNGGDQDYVWEFYRTGLIDKLILNKENTGLGFGTQDLFKICSTEYAIYVQNDQFLGREYTEEEFEKQIEILSKSFATMKSISLAGDQCQGKYGERAHLIKTWFYNEKLLPLLTGGGAGPYHHLEWAEASIQRYYNQNYLQHYIWPTPLFGDNGAFAFRQNPDGSQWRHRTDMKTLELIQGPVKEKYVYPKFTDAEWKQVLETQSWPKDQIPELEKKDSFKFWK